MPGERSGETSTKGESFGERLRRLRIARGLRVTDVAYAAGVTEGSIRQMEAGQTKGATLLVGLRIARSLEVSPEYLATGAEAAEDDSAPIATVLGQLDDHERRLGKLEMDVRHLSGNR